jgi:hypothetical protein
MDQFQRATKIDVKLTSFVYWIKQSSGTIIFGETGANFLDKNWSYISKFDSKQSRIFLFGHYEKKYLRVTIAFQEENVNKVTGEIRFRNLNRSYDLLAMFSGEVKENGENILEKYISDDMSFVSEMCEEINDENYVSKTLNELVDKEYIKSIKIQKSSEKTEDFGVWKKFLDELKVSNEYINNFLNEDLKPEDLQFLTVEELSEFIPKLSDRTKIQKHLLQLNK